MHYTECPSVFDARIDSSEHRNISAYQRERSALYLNVDKGCFSTASLIVLSMLGIILNRRTFYSANRLTWQYIVTVISVIPHRA